MIYELRTYWASEGKREALHERFRQLTLRIFARHNMQVIGFWEPEVTTAETGDVVYLLAFESVAALEAAWQAFRADPEWVAGKAESEAEGPLTTRIASQILLPTSYSPLQ